MQKLMTHTPLNRFTWRLCLLKIRSRDFSWVYVQCPVVFRLNNISRWCLFKTFQVSQLHCIGTVDMVLSSLFMKQFIKYETLFIVISLTSKRTRLNLFNQEWFRTNLSKLFAYKVSQSNSIASLDRDYIIP